MQPALLELIPVCRTDSRPRQKAQLPPVVEREHAATPRDHVNDQVGMLPRLELGGYRLACTLGFKLMRPNLDSQLVRLHGVPPFSH